MSALGQNTDRGVTPNRKTHVIFDANDEVCVEPAFSIEKLAPDIARTDGSQILNMILVQEIGYMIKPYWEDVNFFTERMEGASGFVTPANSNIVLPPSSGTTGIFEMPGYRAPTNSEFSNVATGGSANVLSSGYPLLQKQVAAGADWSGVNIPTDKTNCPPPDSSDDNFVMDRVSVSTMMDDPDRPVLVAFKIPGADMQSPHKIITFYFSARASWDDSFIGSGRYALTFRGDGRASLYEADRSTIPGSWQLRTEFRYSHVNEVAGKFHIICIYKKLCAMSGNGAIVFRLNQPDGDSVKHGNWNLRQLDKADPFPDYIYHISNVDSTIPNPTIPAPLRVDLRRDLSGAIFCINQATGPESGEIVDDLFSLGYYPTARTNFTLSWYGCIPSGATLDLKLLRYSTNTECSLVSSSTYASGGTKIYTPSSEERYYYAVITSTSPDGIKTPVLKSYKCYKDAYIETITPGEKEFKILRKISMTQGERDPSHETFDVSLANLANDASVLFTRSSICTRIESEYDPADSTKRIVYTRGYTTRTNARRRGRTFNGVGIGGGGAASNFPNSQWKELEVQAIGVWQRLYENVAEVRQALFDTTLGLPMKVTDALIAMFGWCGFGADMVDIPDLDTRIYMKDPNARMVIEPTACIGDAIMGLIHDYLGHFLVFDPNAGLYGRWRLLPPQVSPYVNVCEYQTTGPGVGKVQHCLDSYGTTTNSKGQTIPISYVIRDTLRSYVVPPEANLICVSTIGEVSSQGAQTLQTQVAVNPFSYDFDGSGRADPTNPDYLGRVVKMFVMNPAIAAGAGSDAEIGNAVNWFLRRIYDVAAHARKIVEFQTPVIYTNEEWYGTDVNAKPYRLPFYYDPCLLDGQQYLHSNFNPAYNKDHIQVAMVQLEAPRI